MSTGITMSRKNGTMCTQCTKGGTSTIELCSHLGLGRTVNGQKANPCSRMHFYNLYNILNDSKCSYSQPLCVSVSSVLSVHYQMLTQQLIKGQCGDLGACLHNLYWCAKRSHVFHTIITPSVVQHESHTHRRTVRRSPYCWNLIRRRGWFLCLFSHHRPSTKSNST